MIAHITHTIHLHGDFVAVVTIIASVSLLALAYWRTSK